MRLLFPTLTYIVLNQIILIQATVASEFDQRDRLLASANIQQAALLANDKCAECHGYYGKSNIASVPSLACQQAVYTYNQLMAFKHGERSNPTMTLMTQNLSAQTIANLAVLYSQLGPNNCQALRK